ncbi:MAG TPA: hypothetical protein VLY65_00210 [Nitrososphaerales archaeon]|nr:hypothetical protein [Nitrososphaerales archaeon]
MSEESSPAVMKIEADEDFLDHVERGQRKLKNLSLTTLTVTVLLGAAYFFQILDPFVTGEKVVQVNLQDPGLLVVEVLILGLTFAWMYVAALNYLFYTRLGRQVKEIRAKEAELLKRITGQ